LALSSAIRLERSEVGGDAQARPHAAVERNPDAGKVQSNNQGRSDRNNEHEFLEQVPHSCPRIGPTT
jgi:hypothetical protein